MRLTICLLFFLSLSSSAIGQSLTEISTPPKWYSETKSNGITIQNSFPKGGQYPGPTTRNYHYSYLVFFTRIVNETETPLELKINFNADSIAIPNSPATFVKLFLPSDTMTLAKQALYSYGITKLESLDDPSSFRQTINPKGECLFYVVAIFYQTNPMAQDQPRGGNRAELVLEGEKLFYRMPPQVKDLACGQIISKR